MRTCAITMVIKYTVGPVATRMRGARAVGHTCMNIFLICNPILAIRVFQNRNYNCYGHRLKKWRKKQPNRVCPITLRVRPRAVGHRVSGNIHADPMSRLPSLGVWKQENVYLYSNEIPRTGSCGFTIFYYHGFISECSSMPIIERNNGKKNLFSNYIKNKFT